MVAAAGAVVLLGACDREAAPTTQPAPAPSATAAKQAAIVMDAAHDVMAQKDAPGYAIAPSAVLVIELGEHRFPAGKAPDVVHLAHGSSGYFRASFSGKRITLSAGSLDPVRGREAFPGFEAGESYLVAVGAEASGADGAMRFSPAWTAKVNVTAR